jgi:hypothetical protein
MGHPLEIGMATGYSGVEIGYGEHVAYVHDITPLSGSFVFNVGTVVKCGIIFITAQNISLQVSTI